MNIILAAGIFPPDIGGPATYTAELADQLQQYGHTVTVVCFSDTTTAHGESYPVIRIQRSWFKPWTHWQYLRALARVSKGADCLYAQGPTAGGWQARRVAQQLHLPYIVKVVGDYAWEQGRARYGLNCSIEEFQQLTSLPPVVARLKRLQQQVTSEAQAVIVPSQYLAGLVTGWGVAKERVMVIHNAFTPSFNTTPSIVRDQTLFLTGGRLMPWKGFDTLIKLWPQIVAQIPTARLEIVGDGPDEARLQTLIIESGVRSSVTMLGRLSASDMADHYARAKAFILNSDYEGMSHMILEAMSAGAIPLVSRRGGNAELIHDKQTGYLFEYNNEAEIIQTIITVAKDGDQTVSESAIRQANQGFTSEVMISQTMQTLQQIIDKHHHV